MKLVLAGLLFSVFVASTLALPSFGFNHHKANTIKNAHLQYLKEEVEEAQFVHIDRCFQYRDCTGASFSKDAVAAKSACCDKFGGQSYILTDGGICRNCY